MSLLNRVTTALKEAMKARDTVAMETLRAIKSALILKRTETGEAEISPQEELAILMRLQKQRRESATLYRQQKREDLAELEERQASVIARFLPEPLSRAALREAVQEIVRELGATSMKDMGKVMAVASTRLAGRAEGKCISQEVKALLSV